MQLHPVEEIIAEIRQGRMVVVLDDDQNKEHNHGVLLMAAEHVQAKDVNFMARQARGLVCLTLTEERCRLLGLTPMVDNPFGEKSSFTVSIEAREGISTGISAADRAHTIQTATSPTAVAEDIVQPGHVFPLTSAPGGVLTRAGHTEAAADYVRLAGLLPAAMVADVLSADGGLASAAELLEFAGQHQFKIGSIADLIHFRLMSERTVHRLREGPVQTRYGEFQLTAYREQTTGEVHLALHKGRIEATEPTLVRVHIPAAMRDLLVTEVPGLPSWDLASCLQTIAAAGCGVVVLLARQETATDLLHSADLALGRVPVAAPEAGGRGSYINVGLGSQILRDLGVGKIRLLGAPIQYNAISGFDLEVVEYLSPDGPDPVKQQGN